MIYLEDLRNATGGQLFGEATTDRFTGFCRDARLVKPGALYVALSTETGDGHRWIEQALAAGAAGILCQEPPTCDVSRATVVLVGDTAVALGQWAAYILRQYGTMVIGVVGRLGKSRACEAIATVLGTRYVVYQSQQEQPGKYDLLLNLGSLTGEHQVAVLELKGRYPGEMSQLLALVRPQLAVITGIDPVDQIQNWNRPDDVLLEARQVLEALPEQGTAVLNVSDNQLLEMQRTSRAGTMTYAQNMGSHTSPADLSAYNITYYLDRIAFDLRYAEQLPRSCHLPILARPGLSAVLAALCVGLLCDIRLEEGLQALASLRSLPGRLNLMEGARGSLLVDDTFNNAPTAALAALEWLAGVDAGGRQKLLVLGNLAGEGEEAIQSHMVIGQKAAQATDFLIACGEMACVAGRAARRAGMAPERVVLLYNPNEIADVVLGFLSSPGDLVLVEGGQHAQMEHAIQRLLKSPGERTTVRNLRGMEMERSSPGWTSWIELDMQAVARNLQEFRRRLSSGVGVMAVVETNAYGHGVGQIATAALSSGVTMLGVASLDEGMELRQLGIEAPILILGYVLPRCMQQAIAHNLIVSIHDADEMRALAQAARGLGRMARVHLCIDTGSESVGIPWEQVALLVRELVRLEVLEIEGLYTSLSLPGNQIGSRHGREQVARFSAVYDGLHASGLTIPHIHVDGSIAITMPEDYFTMARIGSALVGIDPLFGSAYAMSLHPVLSWKTAVAQVKTLPTKEQVAVIQVGYADGLRITPGKPIKVLLGGHRMSVVGEPIANRSMIYMSNLIDTQVGDEVVLIGKQAGDEIMLSDIAQQLGISTLEFVCAISARIPRIVV